MNDIILDNGDYTAKIANAKWKESPYQIRQNNPLGECLSLWLDIQHEGDRKRIFCDVGIQEKKRLAELMDCVGVTETSDLSGRSVICVVERYTSKLGKVSNIVKSFKAIEKAKPQAAKKKFVAKTIFDDDDNVPF